jgi:hypothetical protein
MDGADWLRTQLTSFGCASCGQAYEAGRIRVLAERDGLFFVDLACRHCDTQAIAIITVQVGDDDDPRAEAGDLPIIQLEPLDQPAQPDRGPAFTADDVLDVHQFLARFSGDTRDLLRLWGQEPAAGEAAPAEESQATPEARPPRRDPGASRAAGGEAAPAEE